MDYILVNESSKLHTVYKIKELEEGFTLLDDLEMHFLELPKLPRKDIRRLKGKELWIYFLREGYKEDNEMESKILRGRNIAMDKAMDRLEEISTDERLKEIYRVREKTRRDTISMLAHAEREGLKKGMEKGSEKAMKWVAKNLLSEGVEINFIVKTTGLSKNEIEKLAKEPKQ